MIDNFVVFAPFGMLLGINLKRATLWRKVALIFSFSLGAELIQFILAIGTTDITDIIMNTLGGLFGLVLYAAGKKYIDNQKLDRFIVAVGSTLLASLILYRVLFIHVRY